LSCEVCLTDPFKRSIVFGCLNIGVVVLPPMLSGLIGVVDVEIEDK
jgi:hypothetical protein